MPILIGKRNTSLFWGACRRSSHVGAVCLGPAGGETSAHALHPSLCERRLERVKGIEPSCPAWEAGVLPLNYTRVGKKLRVDSSELREKSQATTRNSFSQLSTFSPPFTAKK